MVPPVFSTWLLEQNWSRVKYDKNVNAVDLDRDGTHLAVGGDDQTVRIYSMQKLESAPKPATPPERKAPAKDDSANARQVADAFLDAAVAGKIEEARKHADPNHISENKVREIQKAGVKRVDISITLADNADALTISEPIQIEKTGKGHLLLYLRKKDGHWKVRDIDFEQSEKAMRKQRDFLESHPDAKAVQARVK